jgi:hypothetical protein
MTDKRIYRLVNANVRCNAASDCHAAPDGYICEIRPETRRDRQNSLMWALIKDLQDQVPDMGRYSPDDVKERFMNALGQEARFLPELDGGGMFPVGRRSSQLTVKQFSALTELIYAYGAREGVQWSHSPDEF